MQGKNLDNEAEERLQLWDKYKQNAMGVQKAVAHGVIQCPSSEVTHAKLFFPILFNAWDLFMTIYILVALVFKTNNV